MHTPDPDLLAAGRRPASASRWVHVLQGRITAAGCPAKTRLESWAERGATDVVTLQREDEMPPWLPDRCAAAGLSWHHLPLSGRRLEHPADGASLARIADFAHLLRSEARSIVFHCAAGMHRTGLCLYLVMRHHSLLTQQARARRRSIC